MLSFIEGDKKFNFRVGAIILNRDKTKVLLNTIKGYGFYLLPGGRVEWLENCREAIRRELKEEIGLDNIKLRERIFMENLFKFNGLEYDEITLIFVVELEERHAEFEIKENFVGLEGEKHLYKWVEIKDIDSYELKPRQLKTIIKNYQNDFEYLVVDDRQAD